MFIPVVDELDGLRRPVAVVGRFIRNVSAGTRFGRADCGGGSLAWVRPMRCWRSAAIFLVMDYVDGVAKLEPYLR